MVAMFYHVELHNLREEKVKKEGNRRDWKREIRRTRWRKKKRRKLRKRQRKEKVEQYKRRQRKEKAEQYTTEKK